MKHVRELIQGYVAGELDRDQKGAVDAHLVSCPDCRREAEQATALWEMLGAGSVNHQGSRSIWPAVRARTQSGSGNTREWLFGNGPWTRSGFATAAVAAGLVAGILIPIGDGSGTSSPETEGSSWLVDSSWISGSSWLSEDGSAGLDDILLGVDLSDEENGS